MPLSYNANTGSYSQRWHSDHDRNVIERDVVRSAIHLVDSVACDPELSFANTDGMTYTVDRPVEREALRGLRRGNKSPEDLHGNVYRPFTVLFAERALECALVLADNSGNDSYSLTYVPPLDEYGVGYQLTSRVPYRDPAYIAAAMLYDGYDFAPSVVAEAQRVVNLAKGKKRFKTHHTSLLVSILSNNSGSIIDIARSNGIEIDRINEWLATFSTIRGILSGK
jgi:hypothetical protein